MSKKLEFKEGQTVKIKMYGKRYPHHGVSVMKVNVDDQIEGLYTFSWFFILIGWLILRPKSIKLKKIERIYLFKLSSKLFVGESFAAEEAVQEFRHGLGLIQTCSETGALNWYKRESFDLPNIPTDLIFAFVLSRNPPLSPVFENGKLELIFELSDPFGRWSDWDFGVKITWVNPLNKIKMLQF